MEVARPPPIFKPVGYERGQLAVGGLPAPSARSMMSVTAGRFARNMASSWADDADGALKEPEDSFSAEGLTSD